MRSIAAEVAHSEQGTPCLLGVNALPFGLSVRLALSAMAFCCVRGRTR